MTEDLIIEPITHSNFNRFLYLINKLAEYEKLTTFDPNNKDRRLIHPTYHYQLAKLYEQKELKNKAIEKYQKFLKLWKNADEDLPELIDAKKRLANLVNQ